MTQAEALVLEKGRIPAWIVLNEIDCFLSQYEEEEIEGGLIEGIAEKGGVSYDTIYTWLGQRRTTSIDFDTADRILLYTVGPLWPLRYPEYYEKVNLRFTTCGCPGCEKMIELRPSICLTEGCSGEPVARGLCAACREFHKYHGTLEQFPKLGVGGGAQSAYCSKACREAHARMTRGESQSGRRMKARSDRCRNGHKRTPENTLVRKGGKIQCRICYNAASKAGYHRRKKAAA